MSSAQACCERGWVMVGMLLGLSGCGFSAPEDVVVTSSGAPSDTGSMDDGDTDGAAPEADPDDIDDDGDGLIDEDFDADDDGYAP